MAGGATVRVAAARRRAAAAPAEPVSGEESRIESGAGVEESSTRKAALRMRLWAAWWGGWQAFVASQVNLTDRVAGPAGWRDAAAERAQQRGGLHR